MVHAHSVFSHSPIDVIEECLAHVGRVMKPDGFFDFTFDRTEGAEHHVLREDFYYRTETLVALADRHGLTGQFMADWEELPHQQSKLRVTRRPSSARRPKPISRCMEGWGRDVESARRGAVGGAADRSGTAYAAGVP